MKRLILILPIIMLTACEEIDSSLNDAWQKFEAKQYSQAHAAFSNIIPKYQAEAFAGLAWTTMKMDSLAEADRYFQLSADFDTLSYAFAGWAILGWARENYDESLIRAQTVLDREPKFMFQYANEITYQTMNLIQAYDYFYQGDYQSCISKIQSIDKNFTPPNINDPEIHALLLAKLDSLNNLQF